MYEKYDLIKDGFKFTSILYPFNVYDTLMIDDEYPISHYVEYINNNNIKKVKIFVSNIDFLIKCPTLKYLVIDPNYIENESFYEILYKLSNIKFLLCINDSYLIDFRNLKKTKKINTIDYSKIKSIESISLVYNNSHINFANISSLKSLYIHEYQCKCKNLNELFSSKILDTLCIVKSNVETLDGKNAMCLFIL